MADYRQFCNTCGNEVGFGSHRPDCPEPEQARVRAAEREEEKRLEKERQQAPFVNLSDKELIAAVLEADRAASEAYLAYLPFENRLNAGREVIRARQITSEYLNAMRDRNKCNL